MQRDRASGGADQGDILAGHQRRRDPGTGRILQRRRVLQRRDRRTYARLRRAEHAVARHGQSATGGVGRAATEIRSGRGAKGCEIGRVGGHVRIGREQLATVDGVLRRGGQGASSEVMQRDRASRRADQGRVLAWSRRRRHSGIGGELQRCRVLQSGDCCADARLRRAEHAIARRAQSDTGGVGHTPTEISGRRVAERRALIGRRAGRRRELAIVHGVRAGSTRGQIMERDRAGGRADQRGVLARGLRCRHASTGRELHRGGGLQLGDRCADAGLRRAEYAVARCRKTATRRVSHAAAQIGRCRRAKHRGLGRVCRDGCVGDKKLAAIHRVFGRCRNISCGEIVQRDCASGRADQSRILARGQRRRHAGIGGELQRCRVLQCRNGGADAGLGGAEHPVAGRAQPRARRVGHAPTEIRGCRRAKGRSLAASRPGGGA